MSELADQLKTKVEGLKAPIPGDQPCGIDLSYESDFDVVRTEIDKLTSVSGEAPKWELVISSGEGLLKTKTKDMRLVVWVATARFKKDGLQGFATGLAGIHALCAAHWEGMFPTIRRAKARGKLVSWLGEIFLAQHEEWTPRPSDRASLEVLGEIYEELDAFMSEKLGGEYEGMGAMRTFLRDKVRMIPAEVAKPVEAPAAAPSTSSSSAASSSAPAAPVATVAAVSMTKASDVAPALKTLSKGIVEAAGYLKSADPASAWGYHLSRVGAWLAIQKAPPAEGGKTKLPPPPASEMKKLQGLLESQSWAELASMAETLSGKFLFWLDLHRMVAVALDRQGALYQEAKETVTTETLTFVQTYPSLVELSFADGTPFADEATRSWLEEERGKRGSGASGGQSVSSVQLDEEEQELKARFESAKEMIASGNTAGGLSLAMQLSRRGADARARFRARLETAQLALKGSRPDLARPILDGLVMEAATHGLEHWEPELCAQLYFSLIKARLGHEATASEPRTPTDGELLDRLCRLDPALAIKVTK